MVLKHVTLPALLIWLAALPAAQAQDLKTILSEAAKAIGAENLKKLRYSGSGSAYIIDAGGDRKKPTHVPLKSYVRELDLATPASRVEAVRIQGAPPAEETQTTVAAADGPWEKQYDIWLTPYAFLKGAAAGNATMETQTVKGRKFDVVTFKVDGKYEVSGFIDENRMIDLIQTRVMDPVLGDTLVESSFVEYRSFGQVKVPSAITQKRNGLPSVVVVVNDVTVN